VIAGGRLFRKGDNIYMPYTEEYISSVEIFTPKTNTWNIGPDLPTPLAFTTTITTPKGAWIFGGRKSPNDPAAVSVQNA
jgi:N-acetylneuraminic acid mutarotase